MADQLARPHLVDARPHASRATPDRDEWVGESIRDGTDRAGRDGDGAMLGRVLIYVAVLVAVAAVLWARFT
jgi:hypothetical protein